MDRRDFLTAGSAAGVGVLGGATLSASSAGAVTTPTYPPSGLFDITAYGADPAAADNGPAIQAAVDAARAVASNGVGGGMVLFPQDQYAVQTAVKFDAQDGKGGGGVVFQGMAPARSPDNPNCSRVLWTGSDPNGWLQIYNASNWSIDRLASFYTTGFTGSLVTIQGVQGGADCQHWSIRDSSFAVYQQQSFTAQYGLALNGAVIYGEIEGCGFNGFAQHGLLLGTTQAITKRYINDVTVRNCTMNHGTVAHIGIGSPDCENLVVDSVGFEGKYTAIKGLSGHLLYSPRIIGGSCEDGQPPIWMGTLNANQVYGGTVDGVLFGALAVGQVHLDLGGLWEVRNCAFKQGTVFGSSVKGPLTAISNGYSLRGETGGTPSGDLVFAGSQPKNFVSLGNYLVTPNGLTADPRNTSASSNHISPALV